MARRVRVVIPGCPHHVTHRGNLRAHIFFTDDDRTFYLSLLRQNAERFGEFVKALEERTGQTLMAQKRGRRPAGVVNVDLTEDLFG